MGKFYRTITALLLLIASSTSFSQPTPSPLSKSFVIKSNLLNLVVGRPAISFEKNITGKLTAEVIYVNGIFKNFLLTDRYQYRGLLLRLKRYIDVGSTSPFYPYAGAYAGNLRRNIDSKGVSGPVGFPGRSFAANSLRAGGTLGVVLLTKSRIVVDGQTSLGYGRYLHLDRSDPDVYSNGFLDVQLWLSVGYSLKLH